MAMMANEEAACVLRTGSNCWMVDIPGGGDVAKVVAICACEGSNDDIVSSIDMNLTCLSSVRGVLDILRLRCQSRGRVARWHRWEVDGAKADVTFAIIVWITIETLETSVF